MVMEPFWSGCFWWLCGFKMTALSWLHYGKAERLLTANPNKRTDSD